MPWTPPAAERACTLHVGSNFAQAPHGMLTASYAEVYEAKFQTSTRPEARGLGGVNFRAGLYALFSRAGRCAIFYGVDVFLSFQGLGV